jgi:SIR2-like domain
MSKNIDLRNDHYVFILGAGASVARGMPTIDNFFNRMRDALLHPHSGGHDREAIQKVLEFRRDAAAAGYRILVDLENIEELFSLVAAAKPEILPSVQRSIAATLAYCFDVEPEPVLRLDAPNENTLDFSKYWKVQKDNPTIAEMPLYDALLVRCLNALDTGRTTIITFNYDDVIERSMARLQRPIDYGIRKNIDIDPGANHEVGAIKLLKLHGSVNWVQRPKEILSVLPGYGDVVASGEVPAIVPPTWNKTITSHLAEVWSSAVDALHTATTIVVIGFSMPATDLHFKYLLAAGMQENFSLRRVVFVNNDQLVIRSRARKIFAPREVKKGRVQFVPRRFEELVAGVLSDPVRRIYSSNGHALSQRPY